MIRSLAFLWIYGISGIFAADVFVVPTGSEFFQSGNNSERLSSKLQAGGSQFTDKNKDGAPDELLPKVTYNRGVPRVGPGDEVWNVWVSNEGVIPTLAPGGLKEANSIPFGFLDSAYVVARYRPVGGTTGSNEADDFLLLGDVDQNLVLKSVRGWVPTGECILGASGLRDPLTGVHQKAMLVQTIESIKAALASDDAAKRLEAVPLTDKPGSSSNRRVDPAYQKQNIFNIYSRYSSKADKKEYLLLGANSRFDSGNVQKVIKGWIDASRVSQWNTRLCLEWDPQSAKQRKDQPGLVMRDEQLAIDWFDGGGVPQQDDKTLSSLFIEVRDKSGLPAPLKLDDRRIPVLGFKNDNERESELFRVGVFGAFIGKQNEEESVREYVQELEASAETAMEATQNIDLLFVVDGAQVMRINRDSIIEIVDSSLRVFNSAFRSSGDDKRSIRSGVSYYSDVRSLENPNRAFVTTRLGEISKLGDIKQLTDSVRSFQPSAGGAAENDVFQGVIEAIRAARFRENATKLVVLIGNTGDYHTDDNIAILRKKLESLVYKSIPIVAQEPATPLKHPIEFFACRMKPDNQADKGDFGFISQMEKLCEQLVQDRDETGATTFAAVGRRDQPVATMIANRIANLQVVAEERMKLLRAIQAGDSSPIRQSAEGGQSAITQEALEYLRRDGIDIEKVAAIRGAEWYEEGWVWEKSPKFPYPSQVRKIALLTRDEIENVYNDFRFILLQDVGNETVPTESITQLRKQLIVTLVGEQGGPGSSKEYTPSELYSMRNGLPEFQSSFLSDLKKTNVADLGRDYRDLVLRLRRLEDLLKEQDSGWSDGNLRKHSPALTRSRFFTSKNDPERVKWCYVDLQLEWP